MPTTITPTVAQGDLISWGSGEFWYRVTSTGTDTVVAREVGTRGADDEIIFHVDPRRNTTLYLNELPNLIVRGSDTAADETVDETVDDVVQLRADVALLTERLMSAVNGGGFAGYDRFVDELEDELSVIELPERQVTQYYNLQIRVAATGHPDRIHTATLTAAEMLAEHLPVEPTNGCTIVNEHYATALLST